MLRHRDLRAILLAWTLGVAADWMLTVVGLLVAWDIGGAVAVGLFGLVRMAPATVVNLLVDAGAFARPERALVGVGAVRALAAGVVALAVAADAPLVALGAIAVVAAAGALVRPTSLAILPAIATDPADLVGAGVAVSLGGILAPALVAVLGVERALVITGLVLPTLAVLGWPVVRRLDAEGVVPERQAALLRGIPLFCALPLSGLERVAAGMVPVRYPAGARLMTEGEPGDRYLVLAAGSVAVSGGGRDLGRNGPGDGLGEIALLREVPRTATVTALEPVEAFEIDRATFLAAVTGHEPSAAAAERVVAARLGGSG